MRRDGSAETTIDTPRLTLIAYKPEQLLALIEQPDRFEEVAALTPAEGLRGFYVSGEVSPDWLSKLRSAVEQGGGPNPWRHGFWVIEKESGEIVGGAGFKGAPDDNGMVEIAYGIVPSREGRGYATEAARAHPLRRQGRARAHDPSPYAARGQCLHARAQEMRL